MKGRPGSRLLIWTLFVARQHALEAMTAGTLSILEARLKLETCATVRAGICIVCSILQTCIFLRRLICRFYLSMM